MDRLPVVLRPARPEDHPFIVDSWLLAFRSSPIGRDGGAAYMHDFKWLIRRWLEKAAVLVAADEEEPGSIWGWSVTYGSTILYCYVRQEFRGQGIAELLLAPFLKRRDVTVCAKPPARRLADGRWQCLPPGWRYSFLAGLRILAE